MLNGGKLSSDLCQGDFSSEMTDKTRKEKKTRNVLSSELPATFVSILNIHSYNGLLIWKGDQLVVRSSRVVFIIRQRCVRRRPAPADCCSGLKWPRFRLQGRHQNRNAPRRIPASDITARDNRVTPSQSALPTADWGCKCENNEAGKKKNNLNIWKDILSFSESFLLSLEDLRPVIDKNQLHEKECDKADLSETIFGLNPTATAGKILETVRNKSRTFVFQISCKTYFL